MSHSSLILPSLNFLPKSLVIKSCNNTENNTKINTQRVTQNKHKEGLIYHSSSSSSSGLCKCGRRHFLGPTFVTTFLLSFPAFAFDPIHPPSMEMMNKIRPPRADWYEELFAKVMNKCMKGYESEIGRYKRDLFGQLKGQAKEILEIGIGTGPNLKYYAGESGVRVIGVDPNQKMEKYAREAAEAAGLVSENFEFVHAVGEILPVKDASVDAVIGTLVLCSVKDVDRTLQEVKRVLKPGGIYVFIEHVAAEDGTFLRLAQNILNPVQQLVGDNCHLTRESGRYISEAGFSEIISNVASIPKAFIVNPQVYGIARK
ncbi:hypothetical protein RND81_11G042400 [Saponaria officinalis]|uniref:Methyltransferase type 11 domain-containing protein n=3 Tax=Saponaria officinalis TaxID=3572 RepID=A0AAW1HGS0_SAPOF